MIRLCLLFSIALSFLVSCVQPETEPIYIGGFYEKEYSFLESIKHVTSKDYYAELPFGLKFSGITFSSFDSVNTKKYSWLRIPENLNIAFNSFCTVGIDRFVSKEQYYNNNFCCNTLWENKSLNDVVKEFIASDTTSLKKDYYSRFWQRRKREGNIREVYNILVKVDDFYNKNKQILVYKNKFSNPVLTQLLYYDAELMHSDSITYKEKTIDYFEFLKSINLSYSAYKLVCHNSKLKINKILKDSLLVTMEHDTLSKQEWQAFDVDENGWFSRYDYPDPHKYYGP